jgi:hypothetical protein
MPKKLQSPDAARNLLARKYANQHQHWLAGGGSWPLNVPLGVPLESDLAADPASVRQWVQLWQQHAGPGRVDWVERQFGRLGTHRMPSSLVLKDAGGVATMVGEDRRWQSARKRYALLLERWHSLTEDLVAPKVAAEFNTLADYSDEDFARLLRLLAWVVDNPSSGLTLRQLPVAGLDTKWLEVRTTVVASFLRLLRPDQKGDLYTLAGFERARPRIRLRVLCPQLRAAVGGLCDIEAPVEELAALPLRPQVMIAVENLETGLAMPCLAGAVAVMKLGHAVSTINLLPWLKNVSKALYWGDIDTHGFAILHRARTVMPSIESILMDADTLLRFEHLWGSEPIQCADAPTPLLTSSEALVYEGLRRGKWGAQVRLEQERLPWALALKALHARLGEPSRWVQSTSAD